ncbi:glycosyltransferase family 4 protein [Pedobacter jejuensis]|uniref:Glycosyltransferase n=1 Tax=Pedobacter jejuensis TaxID=1268550 RepID=A0A3N0BUY6_9SPHI|nr:glycosyltransferase family 4 protein [Pedobacter jejuensis]RNL52535.1 glycosyltransferase [Pedobacter jejuensis]
MQKIVIVSTCIDDWGGSEELWGRSIPFFQKAGFKITVVKSVMNKEHPQLRKLSDSGVHLAEFDREQTRGKKAIKLLRKFAKEIAVALKFTPYQGKDLKSFRTLLNKETPDLVIISQGINFDGLNLAEQCLFLKIPYVIISQKAVDFYWPQKNDRHGMLKTLLNAKKTFFVSKHNLRLTEEQFGHRLPNAEVIFNPVKLSGNIIPYPESNTVFKFVCLGRLFLLDKGQDIIIRILSEQKWKERSVQVSFIGKGDDDDALKDLAKLLEVTNVEFKGQIDDVEAMWEDYHALLLPSRCEGLPLSMVEAMSAGRPVIISDAGGNTELVEEGVTGFIGFPNEKSFGDAMERAWNTKDNWEQIGKNAANQIASAVPTNPEYDFAVSMFEILNYDYAKLT